MERTGYPINYLALKRGTPPIHHLALKRGNLQSLSEAHRRFGPLSPSYRHNHPPDAHVPVCPPFGFLQFDGLHYAILSTFPMILALGFQSVPIGETPGK